MIFQRYNRTDPEKIYIVVRAIGEALVKGKPVALVFDGANDGLNVHLADTAADCTQIVGLADDDLPQNEYGFCQVYGYRSDATIANFTETDGIGSSGNGIWFSVTSISSGMLSLASTAGVCTDVQPNFIAANSSNATLASSTGTQTCAVFIRCM